MRRHFGRVFRRGRIWYYRVRRPGEEVLRAVGPKRKDAVDALAALQHRLITEAHLGVKSVGTVSLGAFVKTLRPVLAARLSPRAASGVLAHVADAGTRLRKAMADVDQGDVQDELTAYRNAGARSAATVNRHLSALSVAFREALARGYARENPCRGIRRLKEQERPVPYLADAFVDRVVAAAPPEFKPLVLFASETGLRLGELRRLEWRDLDVTRKQVTVRESKSRRVRVVPLSARALEAARRVDRGPASLRGADPVFHLDGPATDRLHRGVRAWFAAAGRPDLRFHDLRHGWACRLAEAGADLFTLMRLGGWASVSMVQRYAAHQPDDAGRRAVDRLDARRGSAGGSGAARRPRAKGRRRRKTRAA